MAAERREPWPWLIAGLLVSMMAISVSFYVVASRNPDAVVVADAYEAGLRYNADLRERRRAEALGLDLALSAQPDEGGVRLAVTIAGSDGRPVVADRVTVRRERPAEGGFDGEVELVPAAGGFQGELPLPLPGRWHLVVTAEVDGHEIREIFRLQAG